MLRFIETKLFLLHAYEKKKSQKAPTTEIEIAERRIKDL